MEKKDEQTSKNIERIVKTEAMSKTIQKYSEAAKQHYVAYSGMDNENGKVLAKGLKDIAKEKINPEYKFSNIHEQAGFSAEVKEVAKSNSKAIISGKPNRKIRTDDLGRVNDQLVDVVTVDKSGKVIKGSEIQMKFLGASQNDPSGTGDVKRALGVVMGAKASKNLDNAYSNLAEAKKYEAEMDAASTLCIGIRRRSAMFSRFLLSLNSIFEPLVFDMSKIIKEKGSDYRNFSEDEKKVVAEAMSLAGAIKAILDTPILDEQGNLTKESGKIIAATRRHLEQKED